MHVIHKKVWPEYFEKILSGKKKLELRLADFDINEGDTLVLEEWDNKKQEYTDRKINVIATHILKTKGQTFWPQEEVDKYGFQVIQFKPKEAPHNELIPELYCSDFEKSVHFYTALAGFSVVYSRPEERFAFLEREGAQLMIEQMTTPESTWLAGTPEYPYGRGMNLQIRVSDVQKLWGKFNEAGSKILLPLEEKWYRSDNRMLGNLQFVALDPDGYLLRFSQSLGSKGTAK